jgi:hypothetical protein
MAGDLRAVWIPCNHVEVFFIGSLKEVFPDLFHRGGRSVGAQRWFIPWRGNDGQNENKRVLQLLVDLGDEFLFAEMVVEREQRAQYAGEQKHLPDLQPPFDGSECLQCFTTMM